MMFPTWMRLMFESSLLGLEAQRVIALRMMALAGGGSRAQAEAQRMITEKLFALIRGGSMLTAGKPPTSVARGLPLTKNDVSGTTSLLCRSVAKGSSRICRNGIGRSAWASKSRALERQRRERLRQSLIF